MLAARTALVLPPPAFGSVFQGAIRTNTYVGLAAAGALLGQPGLVLASVGIAVVIPLVNVLSVVALIALGTRGAKVRERLPRALVEVARNPIILAIGLGALINLAGIHKPAVLADTLEILGHAALPVGLLAVGAALDLRAARAGGIALAFSCVIKLLLVPAATWLAGQLIGVQGITLTVAVLFNALPVSPSAYVLARQLGGDGALIAGILTAQTLLAAATMPLVLTLFS